MERRYRFGPWEVQADQRTVLREGQPVSLGSRAFDVLLQLLRQRGRLVSKSELLDTVWTDLMVEESNVQVQVSALRKEFGAGVIATIPGRGYRFVAPLLDEDLPAATLTAHVANGTVAAGDHNLPLAPDPLIGREAELAWLIDALQRGRLVTVLGPGGIGKTRVAQQVSRLLSTTFAHGRWWVDLAAVTTLRQAVVAIANAAQVQLAGADADSTDLLLGLSARHTLLVLDN
jgi:DNA-binding winged helix-turn-helix (wHTH) protein